MLEYLTAQERETQRAIVIRCMEKIPARVEDLIEEFIMLAPEREGG